MHAVVGDITKLLAENLQEQVLAYIQALVSTITHCYISLHVLAFITHACKALLKEAELDGMVQ